MNSPVSSQTRDPSNRKLRLSMLFIMATLLLFACIQPAPKPESSLAQPHGSHAAPELGVVVDETMKVVDVDPGNAAEKAGVQKGDLLIAIEDIPFATEKAKAEELIWGSADEAVYEDYAKTGEWQGKRLRLLVQRDGNPIELEIMPAPPIWDPKSPPTPGYAPFDYL